MATYSPVTKHESKTTPGVVFVLRRLTEGLRSKLEDATWEHQQVRTKLEREILDLRASPELKPLADEMGRIMKSSPAILTFTSFDELREEDKRALERFNVISTDSKWDQVRALAVRQETIENNSINHVYFEKTLVRVEGFQIEDEDGNVIAKPTPRQWIDFGPEEIYKEILREIRITIRLDAKEIKNSESPSTSSAQADGPTKTTTAELVAA